jgi:hypothetical protein
MRNVFGWLSGKLNDATASVGRAMLTRWARKWAEGEIGGARGARLYYFLSRQAGHITTALSVLAGLLMTAAQWKDLAELVHLDPALALVWSERLAYIAPVLVSIKLATDQWHSITKPLWLSKPWAVWLADHAAALSIVFGAAWGWAQDCGDGGWCDLARWGLYVAGLFGANFGFISRASRAQPPQQVLEALAGLVTAQTPKIEKQALTIEHHPDREPLKDALASAALDPTTEPAPTIANVAHAIAPLEGRRS